MPMDYQGNANKDKEKKAKPEKRVEKVVSSEVIVQKKSLGRKFKDTFIEADLKSVVRYLLSDVLLPAARNTIVDASTKGIERMIYGEAAMRRRSMGAGPRITYNSPINRFRDATPERSRLTPGESRSPRHSRDDFILSSREEAELVLERMNDIIDTYEVVSVADLNDLVGFPTSYIDNKWGWIYLGDVQIRQIREGYLIDLPAAEPIQS
jgi:hypothetical protein